MIKLFLITIFLLHLFGFNNIVKSGDKSKIGIQVIVLTWSSLLLLIPQLNPKPFILLITVLYLFTSSVLLWIYSETNQKEFLTTFLSQAFIALFDLIALFS